jgi:predicted nucleotidyltransferase
VERHRGELTEILEDFPDGIGLFDLGPVREELETVVHVPVDLVPAEDLRPGVRENVDREAIPL